MKTTNKSTVEFVDRMGSDMSIANAARVSFNKVKYDFDESDERLIKYLAKHNHWSPFAHTSIQLRISAPLFIARQLVKHQVGGVWNEVSRRYVDEEPVFYVPEVWRGKADNKKQGSTEGAVEGVSQNSLNLLAEMSIEGCLDTYLDMLDNGVCPEQARMVLPQNMMTTWIWTGSLMFFHRVYKQRIDEHAQKEVQDVAKAIGDTCSVLFPVSWGALNEQI